MNKQARSFKQIVIVGLGLLGGSLALEFKKKRLAQTVIGVSRAKFNRVEALRRKAVDEVYAQMGDFLRQTDLLIFATPVESIPKLLKQAKPYLSPHVLVTDVGSTKEKIVSEAKRLGIFQFVGGHPIAGTEKSGMKAAQLGLFKNKKWILTPTYRSPSLKKWESLLKKMGANVIYMSSKEHDQILAAVSHLPNVIAYALANAVDQKNSKKNISFAGSSLKEMTRVAASPPEMWRDICLANSQELGKTLALFQKQLAAFQKAIRSKDAKKLQKLFARGNRFRKRLEK